MIDNENFSNTDLKLASLLDTMNNLNEVLDEENVALKEYDIDKISQLMERKQPLSRLYQEQMRAFAGNPKLLEELSPDDQKVFKETALELDENIKKNQCLLKANMEANERLVKTIVEAANRKKQEENPTYNVYGGLGRGGRPKGTDNAFSYNRTL